MDYDFGGMCCDQLEKLDKRLAALSKAFVKEYMLGLNVINNATSNEHRGETKIEIEDILNDTANKASISYTQAMNKIQSVLVRHL